GIVALTTGCDQLAGNGGSSGNGAGPNDTPAPAPARTEFTEESDSLAAAIARARESAEEARLSWQGAPPEDHARWWVKWAAPTQTGGVEHVWIQPDKWSAFRLEGTLTSTPTRELACGRTLGDRVSFPADELSDWLFVVDPGPPPLHRGGFTIDALDDAFGP
ncbi:MAG: DUF2314 domain-containing protein, partial [Phycisphaerales bacterium]|nr:DUF2314 domain-containing protein [Phycisphaerales bacterium]